MAKSLNDLSPRTQLIVFALLSALAAGGAWQVLLSPERTQLEARRTRLGAVEREVASAQAVALRLPAVQREIEELQAALDATTAVIPEEKDPQEVLRSLHEMASQSLLSIATFTPKPIVTKAEYSEWPVELGLEGGYHDLGVFFDRIANMPRLMSVSELQIRTPTRQSGRGTIAARCIATTFVFRAEPPAEAGGQQ
jgi:type IV pilus assembly protein PilO